MHTIIFGDNFITINGQDYPKDSNLRYYQSNDFATVKVKDHLTGKTLIPETSYTTIINPDTGVAYVSAAALKTQWQANFIKATGGAGGSDADTFTGTVSGISALPDDGQLEISFTGAAGSPDGYKVQASAAADFSTGRRSATGSSSPITITGLANGTVYHVRARATKTGKFPGPWVAMAGTATPAVSVPSQDLVFIMDGTSQEADEGGTGIGAGTTPSPGYPRPSVWQFERMVNAGLLDPGVNIIAYYNEAAAGDKVEGDIGPGSGMYHPTELGRIQDIIDAHPGKRIIYMNDGAINNLQSGEDAATAYGKYKNLLLAVQAMGAETIGCTATPSNNPTLADAAAVDAERIIYNQMIRDDYQTDLNCIAVADEALIEPVQDLADTADDVWIYPTIINTATVDLIHGTENLARAKALLLVKVFNESIIPAVPAVVSLDPINTTNPLVTTAKHDGNTSYFTYTGDWTLPAPSGSGLGAPFRNGDVTYYSPGPTSATVSWSHETAGEIDEGVDIYFQADRFTTKAMLSIDGAPAFDLLVRWSANINPPASKYPIRVLGAGVHTFSLQFVGRSGGTPAYFFDGIDTLDRLP